MRNHLALALCLPLLTVLACSELDTTSMETTQHALSFVPNLPYHSGYALYVTQGWNGSYSHSGNQQYALDSAKSGCKGEQVLAVGDGTVSYRYDDC
ncbi:MAG: hypothetical protein RBU37_26805, partial [Myxococcota bacterium]|nr:hypothetical protein [Myxococcota bacterium]